MKNLKLYDDFNYDSNILTINKNLVHKIKPIVDSLPEFIKNKLIKEYNNGIDIDSLISIIDNYDIFNKIKKLYDNGITNIKDIFDNLIYQKNESALMLIGYLIIGIITGVAWFTIIRHLHDGTKPNKIRIIILLIGLALGIAIHSIRMFSDSEQELKIRELESKYEIEIQK